MATLDLTPNVGLVFRKSPNVVYCSPPPLLLTLLRPTKRAFFAQNRCIWQNFRLRRHRRRSHKRKTNGMSANVVIVRFWVGGGTFSEEPDELLRAADEV